MKRLLTVAIVMAAVLVGAPLVIGNVAEERVNRGLEGLTRAAPYLDIVERKYSQGWFRSEHEVTFEVLSVPTRFTVRSEILHGPVLGLSGLGLARVNSRLVLDDDTGARLVGIFGTDEPVRVSTRVGFLGGGTTVISGDARTINPKNGAELSWDEFKLAISYAGNLDSVELSGDCDSFTMSEENATNRLVVRGMKLAGTSERIRGKVYGSDLEFGIDEITYGGDGAQTTAKDWRYFVDTSDDGDFMSVATRLGSGAIESKELSARGLELKGMHFDVTVRRLHIETFDRLLAVMDAIYGEEPTVGMTPIRHQGYQLLKLDPEIVIERFGIEASDGEAYFKGLIRLKGVNDKDLIMGPLSLIARLDVDLRMEAPQELIGKLDDGRQSMLDAVEGGYAELRGDKVVSHLEFHDGELMVNGKVQAIPGLEELTTEEEAEPE